MNQSKNTPLLFVLVVGIAGAAFFAGRQTLAPGPAVHPVEEKSVVKDEHGHDEHAGEEAGAKDEHGHDEHAGEEIEFEGDAARTAGIQVAPVRLESQDSGIPFNGQIEPDPDHIVRVSSLVPGRVTRLLVKIGDRVRRGQTLAIVESRAIGEAQSAFQQSVARLNSAKSNLDMVAQQAKAGVFSRAPLETARKAQVEALANVRAEETAVRQLQVALDNALRLAQAGSFASPALEAARAQEAAAEESLKTAQAAADNAKSSVEAAQSELERRKQLAAAGSFQSRPVEEARRALAGAKSARNTAQSSLVATRANLGRAKALAAEGLVSQRDLEAAQNAFETATAQLEGAQSDESSAQTELDRQQKLAATNVAGTAEVQEAQAKLAAAQADVRTRQAEVNRAEKGVALAEAVVKREANVFDQGIANRREVTSARSLLETARGDLERARQTLDLSSAALQREERIFRQNLNNTVPLQAARSAFALAQSDVRAARTALALFKSAPGRAASIPIVAPFAGVVQTREVVQGEVLETDAHVLTLANMAEVHVDMFLPERDIAKVRVGAPVSITVDALPGRSFAGFIELIHTELDKTTRTVEAHATLRNPGDLRFGMFARGRIQTGSGTLQIIVPAEAVQEMEGKKVVFLPGKNPNTFLVREIVSDAAEGGRIVIKSGLKPGEKVVVKGAFMVKAQASKGEGGGHGH